jgi:hypothetical protein
VHLAPDQRSPQEDRLPGDSQDDAGSAIGTTLRDGRIVCRGCDATGAERRVAAAQYR